jgi:hypothetical protein
MDVCQIQPQLPAFHPQVLAASGDFEIVGFCRDKGVRFSKAAGAAATQKASE